MYRKDKPSKNYGGKIWHAHFNNDVHYIIRALFPSDATFTKGPGKSIHIERGCFMKSKIIVNKFEDVYEMDDNYFLNVKYEVPLEFYRKGYEILTQNRENEQKTLLKVLKDNSFPIYMHVMIDDDITDEIDQVTYTTKKIKNAIGEMNYYTLKISNESQLKKYSEMAYYFVFNAIAEVFFSNNMEDSIIVKNEEYILKSSYLSNDSFILWITYDALALHYITKNNLKFEQYYLD